MAEKLAVSLDDIDTQIAQMTKFIDDSAGDFFSKQAVKNLLAGLHEDLTVEGGSEVTFIDISELIDKGSAEDHADECLGDAADSIEDVIKVWIARFELDEDPEHGTRIKISEESISELEDALQSSIKSTDTDYGKGEE